MVVFELWEFARGRWRGGRRRGAEEGDRTRLCSNVVNPLVSWFLLSTHSLKM